MPRLSGALAALLAGSALASPPAVPGAPLTTPPVLDGKIDEIGEWGAAARFQGAFDAETGSPAPDGATYWLGYDKDFLYFAVRADDREPGSIRANEYRTNVGLFADDHITLSVDPTGAMQDFNRFQFNTRGATNVEVAGGRAGKREWSGEVTSAGRITPTGYEIEARIPWSVMALPGGGGKRTLRFNVDRWVPRTGRRYTYTFTNNGRVGDTPEWREVLLPRPFVDHSLKLLPYLYTGYDAGRKRMVVNSGVDLKTSITSTINLVGSISPDFRNVENQILSLDFSRFERLAGETRPFFQEGSGYYGSSIVATQRFPDFDGGLNLYGKIGDKLTFGLLDTLDVGERNNLAFASEYQFDPVSSLRVGLTSLASPGLDNTAYVARYERTFGSFYGQFRHEGSFDDKEGQGSRTRANFFWGRGFWGAYGNYAVAQPDFLPRLGFVQEVDYKGPSGGFFFGRPFQRGPLQNIGFSADYLKFDRASTGEPYRRSAGVSGDVVFRNGLSLYTGFSEAMFLGTHDKTISAGLGYPRGSVSSFSINTEQGIQADQPYALNSINANYRFGWRFSLGGSFQSFKLGDQFSDQLILSGNYDLGGDKALVGRLVKRGGDFGGYVAFRRSGNRGAEYFLIFGDPNAGRFVPSIVLKATFPLRIG